jgi:hypothetical protein
MLRWLRGAVGLSLIWAATWIPLSAVVVGVLSAYFQDVPPPKVVLIMLGVAAGVGAIAGLAFAVFVTAASRRRSASLTLGRLAISGGIAGLITPVVGASLIPVPLATMATLLGIGALIGATCGGVTYAALQRANRADLAIAPPVNTMLVVLLAIGAPAWAQDTPSQLGGCYRLTSVGPWNSYQPRMRLDSLVVRLDTQPVPMQRVGRAGAHRLQPTALELGIPPAGDAVPAYWTSLAGSVALEWGNWYERIRITAAIGRDTLRGEAVYRSDALVPTGPPKSAIVAVRIECS